MRLGLIEYSQKRVTVEMDDTPSSNAFQVVGNATLARPGNGGPNLHDIAAEFRG
jgi:hypothetical protein